MSNTVFALFKKVLDENAIEASYTMSYTWDSNMIYQALDIDIQSVTMPSDALKNAVLEMVRWAPEGASKVDQVKAVHDWLVRNCSYNTTASDQGYYNYTASHIDDPWSAEGALIYNRPVCAGYAAAFQLGMQRLGIPCQTVINTAANHAWNRVKIDGYWYHVDVTWDDPLRDRGYWGTIETKYFMKSDSRMAGYYDGTHGTWDTKSKDVPATSTIYDYAGWGSYSGSAYHPSVYSFTMTKSAAIAADGRKTLSVKLDDSAKKPFRMFTWSSSNPGIVAVTQNGVVTSRNKLGKAIITCTVDGITRTCTVWVKGGSLKAKSVKKALSKAAFGYNGKYHVPGTTLKQSTSSGNVGMKKGTDYTVSYQTAKGKAIAASKIKNAGTYYVVLKGKGLYSGTVKLKFRINPASIVKAKISGVKNKMYNGKKQSQSKIVVKLGKKTLRRGTEYTVSYQNAKGKAIAASKVKGGGTYYVVVKGKGNYAKSLRRTFKIIAPVVAYRTHVQRIGWQGYVKNGKVAGTTGKSLRLEGMNVKVGNKPVSGGIQYRTHIQRIGWEKKWKSNNQMSGTQGKSLRLEAMQIRLTGKLAKYYDVYYRVHSQRFGWMGWAKNGQRAGTAGYSYRLEAMQIKLVPKGAKAPGSTKGAFYQRRR